MTSKTFYICGPMSFVPQFNYPAFDFAAAYLRQNGWEITSPAEMDDPETRRAALASPDGAPGSGSVNGETWGDFLSRDVKLIADGVRGIIFLPNWQRSRGAKLEATVGILCGHLFYNFDPTPGLPESMALQQVTKEWVKGQLAANL